MKYQTVHVRSIYGLVYHKQCITIIAVQLKGWYDQSNPILPSHPGPYPSLAVQMLFHYAKNHFYTENIE